MSGRERITFAYLKRPKSGFFRPERPQNGEKNEGYPSEVLLEKNHPVFDGQHDHEIVIAPAAKISPNAVNSLTLSLRERAGVRGKSLLNSPAHKFLHKF
jgi:hypothetical protein